MASKDNVLLIFIRGLPGSGKTYIADRLRSEIDDYDLVALDPDSIDYDSKEYAEHTAGLTKEGVDIALHPYRFLRGQAYEGIVAGKTIMWNQPFTNLEIFNKMVARLQNHAREHGVSLKILVVEVEIDPAVAKERIEHRRQIGGHGPSENTFARFVREYHSFADNYDTISVRGNDVDGAVASIMSKVK